jgi:hypothetical protein
MGCNINEIPADWEADLPIKVKMIKFDRDLPMYFHAVEIEFGGVKYPGTIAGDHGIRTGCQPILQMDK